MPIIRAPKAREGYTITRNNIYNERGLSNRAKGIYGHALSRPDDWKFSKRGLMYYCTEKECALETALQELEKYYYLVRKKNVRENGRFSTEYTFYELPYKQAQTDTEKTTRLKTKGRQVTW